MKFRTNIERNATKKNTCAGEEKNLKRWFLWIQFCVNEIPKNFGKSIVWRPDQRLRTVGTFFRRNTFVRLTQFWFYQNKNIQIILKYKKKLGIVEYYPFVFEKNRPRYRGSIIRMPDRGLRPCPFRGGTREGWRAGKRRTQRWVPVIGHHSPLFAGTGPHCGTESAPAFFVRDAGSNVA